MNSPDYDEFIAVFNAHGVRYLVIGAHAVAFHSRPRATKDLDLWIDPTPENGACVLQALAEFFGGAELGYTVQDLTDPGWIVQLGVAPVRIDLLASVAGCPEFAAAWRNRSEGVFGSTPTQYVGLEDLIRAKETANRSQDRVDVRTLRRARTRRR